MVSPDSQATTCPPSGRNSTYRPVQISETSSVVENQTGVGGIITKEFVVECPTMHPVARVKQTMTSDPGCDVTAVDLATALVNSPNTLVPFHAKRLSEVLSRSVWISNTKAPGKTPVGVFVMRQSRRVRCDLQCLWGDVVFMS